MKQHLYLSTLSALLLAGCGKDREMPLVLAGSFQAGSTITTADITMYTSAGRVDNPPLLDKFLARRKNLANYFSRVDVPLPVNSSITLTFRGNNRATLTFKNPTYTDSIRTEITTQSPQRLVLANLDSVGFSRNSSAQNRAEQLSETILSEQAGRRCFSVASGSNLSSQYCRVRPVRVITSRGGQLFLPQLSWIIQTRDLYNNPPTTTYWAYAGVQNTFNAAVLNQLIAGDTLVVQAREIPFLKR